MTSNRLRDDPRAPEPPPHHIHNDRDLEQFWRAVLGPLGFSKRRLWLVMIDAYDEPIQRLIEVDDLPLGMDPRDADNLMTAFGVPVRDDLPGGSLAILLTRPGRDQMRADDRRIALELTRAAGRAGVGLRPIHLANDAELRVFAVDDLIGGDRPAGAEGSR